LTKLTERVHGEVRFRSVPPLLVPQRNVSRTLTRRIKRSERRNSAASMPRAAYADQNELDHQQLAEAAAAGEVPTEIGI
jgi:hypothetical protein